MALSTEGGTSLGPGPMRVRLGGLKICVVIARRLAGSLDSGNGFGQSDHV